ncbi:MAG: glycosyltransferase family 2 protein [Candidatus Omnitrophica bacterium]|nr:glycosyltransferase family 2 protein [Candidatus Omnitrophota bacterium]
MARFRKKKDMKKVISLSVIVPAYNEQDSVSTTVMGLVTSLNQLNIDWQLIIVEDGSTDNTSKIIAHLAAKYINIKVIKHESNFGIGRSFRDGVESADKEIVTWIPADGENDLESLIEHFSLLEQADIIVPFVTNMNLRSWKRRFLSKLYLCIVNFSFGTMFNYTNGTIVYKRKVFEIVKPKSNGFFFNTECLIKAVRSGFIFTEVPVLLKKRELGGSKALNIKSFYCVILEYVKLFLDVYIVKRD